MKLTLQIYLRPFWNKTPEIRQSLPTKKKKKIVFSVQKYMEREMSDNKLLFATYSLLLRVLGLKDLIVWFF